MNDLRFEIFAAAQIQRFTRRMKAATTPEERQKLQRRRDQIQNLFRPNTGGGWL